MTSISGHSARADRSSFAVLCGVEALSAQQWVVGAISLCADVCVQNGRTGRVFPSRICGADRGFARTI